MLLTLESEISAYLPTSKWRDADRLLSVIEEEEENTLVPILGRRLFDHLNHEYEMLLENHGGITPDVISKDATDDTVRLLRVCQKIILYLSLGNNSGLLGVSFNAGGGMNVASSEYYDNADKDSIARFERDTWKKAHRNIDTLLSLLERDAHKEEPLFAELWRSSPYFYLKSNLLFSTAMQLQDYLDIKGSRERYIELVPDIKYCQGIYLSPQVGEELLNAFIKTNTERNILPVADAPSDDVREYWREASDRLRTALACYIEHRNTKLRRPDSLSEADMSLARAIQYISDHQSSFEPYVSSSPFYRAEEEVEAKSSNPELFNLTFDPHDPDNMITVLRPTLRRF